MNIINTKIISKQKCDYNKLFTKDLKNILNYLAEMYIQIFGVEPWNEGYICQNCGKLFSLKQKNPKCCGKISPFYNKIDLLKDFKSWFNKSNFIGVILENTKKQLNTILYEPIGFAIGWGTNLYDLNKEKLKLSQQQLKILEKNILKTFANFPINDFFYLADMGLKEEFRNKGLASKLFEEREKEIKNKGYSFVLVRTTRKSDVPFKWYLKLGFKIVFEYNDQQDRVILIRKI